MLNTNYHLQAQTQYMLTGAGGSASNDLPNAEAKLLWNTFSVDRLSMLNFSSSLSARPMPPPPPYSAAATQHAAISSCPPAVLYNQGSSVVQPSPPASAISDSTLGMNAGRTLASNFLPSFASQFLTGRPSVPNSFFGTPLQQVQLSSGLQQNVSNPQSSVSSVEPRPPPPPPQQPHPSQTLQQLGTIQLSHQDRSPSYALGAIPSQVQLQFPNQLPVPQLPLYPQSQQEFLQPQRQVGEQSQHQNQGLRADDFSQQHNDSEINLNQFFSSPEAIQVYLDFNFEILWGELNFICDLQF
jgi:hypothetical protein